MRALGRQLRALGFRGFAATAVDRLRGRTPTIAPIASARVRDGRGIEIGGPSVRFGENGLLPLYNRAATVDNVNFACATLWEPELAGPGDFTFGGASLGSQYIAEATALDFAANGSYDFVLSSHAIEHTANPLSALREWRRVVRSGGSLIMIVPHREGTFDHRRPVTSIDHLVSDLESGMDENDTTHFEEILKLHDFGRDLGVTMSDFKARLASNQSIRSAHHHVFDASLVATSLQNSGWSNVIVEVRRPYDILAVATNLGDAAGRVDEPRFLGSPFARDNQTYQ